MGRRRGSSSSRERRKATSADARCEAGTPPFAALRPPPHEHRHRPGATPRRRIDDPSSPLHNAQEERGVGCDPGSSRHPSAGIADEQHLIVTTV